MNDFSLEPPIRDLLDQPGTVLLRDAVFIREEVEPVPWTHVALAVSVGANLGLVVLLATMFGVFVSLPPVH